MVPPGCCITTAGSVTWHRSLTSAPSVLPLTVCLSEDNGVPWSNRRDKSRIAAGDLNVVRDNLQHWDNVAAPPHRRPAGTRSRWPPIVPRPLIYSSNISDVDPVQLSELWALTLKVNRDPRKIMTAFRHTYAFVVVLAQDENDAKTSSDNCRKLVGVGRAVSDGAFIATICDVAVHPSYQRRGIGRRIVKQLVQDMRNRGGPTGFAVFPPPHVRHFFWMIGFRAEKKYRIMAFRGKERTSAPSNDGDCLRLLTTEEYSWQQPGA